MGSRDVKKREARKPKKGATKAPAITALETPPPEVQVIKKVRKPVEEAEE